VFSRGFGGIGQWYQFVDAGCRPAVDEFGEDVGGSGQRIDAVELAGLQQRRDLRPAGGAAIVTGEECILTRTSETANRALDRIAIDLDAAVVEEADEAAPVVEV